MNTSNKKILTPELEDELTNLVLSEDEIYHDNISVESLYVLDCDSKSFGPISASALQKFIEHNEEIYSSALIRKFGNDEPVALNKHKFFTKESINQNKSVEYIVSINGKEQGVFTLEQVNSSLNAGNISVNDMYSIDGGKSWNRLSKIINKSITQSTKDDLPTRPDEPIFHQSRTDIIEKFIDEDIKDEETNKSIQALARWGHSNKSDSITNENGIDQDQDQVKSSKKIIIATSIAATLVLTIFSFKLFFWTIDSDTTRAPASIESEDSKAEEDQTVKKKANKKKKHKKNDKKKTKKKSKKKTKKKSKKKTKKKPRKKTKKKSKKKNKKKSKSFKKSSAYKKKKEKLDNDYYYDNDSPIETDDARSKLSQKMVDPYSEDYDTLDNMDTDDRRPASENFHDNDNYYPEDESDPYNYDQNEI